MASTTYTLNVTATDIINALKAGKSILIHITENNGAERFVAPIETGFSTNWFTMRMPIFDVGNTTCKYIDFTSSDNLNSILTAEYKQGPDIS